MNIGVLTRLPSGWASRQLIKAIRRLGYTPFPFKFNEIIVHLKNGEESIYVKNINIVNYLDAVIVRPIGRSSLDQAIYRLDILYSIDDLGIKVINSPSAIEKAVDKYRTLHLLLKSGLPVPETLVTENSLLMLRNLDKLNGDIVIKPIFGSRGFGSTKVGDKDIIWRIARTLSYFRKVLYFQRYIEHGHKDIRAFVVGDEVIAAMYRYNPYSWKTNVARGGKPIPFTPNEEIRELAIKASKVIGCEYAGVDIIETKNKYYILEVNSQPTWRGLQSITKVNIANKIVKYIVDTIKR